MHGKLTRPPQSQVMSELTPLTSNTWWSQDYMTTIVTTDLGQEAEVL